MTQSRMKKRLLDFVTKQGLLIAFFIVVIFFALASDVFLSYKNMMLILRQVSIVGTIAIGMTLVIVAGHFDLSVGSLASLTTVVVISLHDRLGPVTSILITLVVGAASGTLVGYLVGYLRLNSMIVTLGFLAALQAVTLIYTGGRYSQVAAPEDAWFGFIGRGFVAGIPVPVILLAILIIIFSIVMTKTIFGRRVLAVGGSSTASRFSGINDKKVTLMVFLLCGVLTAIAGIILGSRMMAAQNYIGQGYEFQVISGVILGGVSLSGGKGSVFKAFIGILIIGILKNGFILMGFPYYTQWVAQWVIVLAVVWIDVATERGKVLGR